MIIDVGRIVLRLSVAKLRWYQLGKQGDLVVLPKRRRRTGNPSTNIRPYWVEGNLLIYFKPDHHTITFHRRSTFCNFDANDHL